IDQTQYAAHQSIAPVVAHLVEPQVPAQVIGAVGITPRARQGAFARHLDGQQRGSARQYRPPTTQDLPGAHGTSAHATPPFPMFVSAAGEGSGPLPSRQGASIRLLRAEEPRHPESVGM